MKPAPRPPARLLLAGRFLVPRAALLALPDGPVPALDLSSGALIALAYGPTGAEAEEVAVRCTRWNELALPGCPAVRELCMHLGRPLVICELRPPRRERVAVDDLVERAAELGRTLDRAGLALRLGPADLCLGDEGPFLRRPAIWPCDEARPLASALAAQAVRLLGRAPVPAPVPVDAPERPWTALRGRVPGSPRARLVLVLAAGLVSALVASSLAGSAGGSGGARAAPRPPVATAPLPVRAPRTVPALAEAAAPPPARGGPAVVLLRTPAVARAGRPAVVPPPPRAPVVPERPARGWVEGLFVAS